MSDVSRNPKDHSPQCEASKPERPAVCSCAPAPQGEDETKQLWEQHKRLRDLTWESKCGCDVRPPGYCRHVIHQYVREKVRELEKESEATGEWMSRFHAILSHYGRDCGEDPLIALKRLLDGSDHAQRMRRYIEVNRHMEQRAERAEARVRALEQQLIDACPDCDDDGMTTVRVELADMERPCKHDGG